MNLKLSLILLFCLSGVTVECARILGVFPTTAPSHYILGNALMKGLAEAGHDVTMISPFEDKTPPANGSYRDIVMTGLLEAHKRMAQSKMLLNMGESNSFATVVMVHKMTLSLTEVFLNHPNVKKLLNSKEKFDVIIVQQVNNDAMKILGHHFNAPFIAFSTIAASSLVNGMTGNPASISYVPNILSTLPTKMNFIQRLHNVILYLLDQISFEFFSIPFHKDMLRKHFTDPPDFYDLYYNTSLVLLNSHECLGQAMPLVPNMIQIGGFHVQKPKPLPKDLQEFLDNAKEGVIYFSMGSNLKSQELPLDKRDALLKAFGKLKEKVLWKWEDDVLPGQPANVKLGKWFPQQDILAHPNVKLFITHGGLLSTTETVYHGVPILAIPVFADQHVNARTAELNGYALRIPFQDPTFSEEKLSALLHEMLDNPTYRNNAKERSRLFHDRPLTPMENAVYWVEYAIRHKGAHHLRVAGVRLPWYQYLLLDVFAFILAVIISVFIMSRILIKRLFKGKSKQKVKEN